MNFGKHDDSMDSEIPMVAAIPAPRSTTEDDCVQVYQCTVEEGDDNGVEDSTSPQASLEASNVTVTTASPSQASVGASNVTATPVSPAEAQECQPSSTENDTNEPMPPTPSTPAPSTLALDQLVSPDPSLVVTDERYQECSTIGKWKTTLFSCFSCDVLCTSLPWMACGCNSIVIGQLMTRLRLDWCARPNHEAAVRTFGIFVSITFAYLASSLLGIGFFLLPFFSLWLVVLSVRLRRYMRNHYRIPARHCCPNVLDGLLEDVCLVFWCPCCVSVQMARQTHDEKRYPYECFSPTGLPTYAPAV